METSLDGQDEDVRETSTTRLVSDMDKEFLNIKNKIFNSNISTNSDDSEEQGKEIYTHITETIYFVLINFSIIKNHYYYIYTYVCVWMREFCT